MPSDFNPLPPCGGRQPAAICYLMPEQISIHSLRVEGDQKDFPERTAPVLISIHSLRVEGDYKTLNCEYIGIMGFQSTPSVWRETACTTS